MSRITYKNPIGNFPAYKYKNFWRSELTPYTRFMLSYVDPKKVEAIDFNAEELIQECILERENWFSSLKIWFNTKNKPSKELIINDSLIISDYQTKRLELLFLVNRAFLLMEQGTGKTPIALAMLSYRKNYSTVIACPNNARAEWALMLDKFFPEMKYVIIDEKDPFVVYEDMIYIIGYDRLIRINPKHTFDIVILDEVHKIKSLTGKRHKTADRLSSSAKYVYGLSGTLYGNKLQDVFGSFKVVEERLFGIDKNSFEQTYLIYKTKESLDGNKYKVLYGYNNLPEFKSRLDSISYRVELRDVVSLKEPREIRLWAKKPAEYNVLKRDYILQLKDDVSVVDRLLNLTQKLQGLCSGFTHGQKDWHIINTHKLDALFEWIEDNEEQAIIFLAYDMSEMMITKELEKRKLTYSQVSKFSRDSEKAKLDFKEKKVQYILIKYSSGTEAMNFQNCRQTIFYDIPLSHIEHSQAKFRTFRRGQEHECLYIYMLTEKSVEVKIMERLKMHQDFSDYLLNGGSIDVD